MSYKYFHRPVQLLQAELGLDGLDYVDAGETIEIDEGSRETSDGTTRVVSTGETRSVSGVAALSAFDMWISLEAATATNVVLDDGCQVAYGDAPKEDDVASLGSPIRAPFTKIITKAAGGAARAYRLRNRP